jgi:hypothetical protein
MAYPKKFIVEVQVLHSYRIAVDEHLEPKDRDKMTSAEMAKIREVVHNQNYEKMKPAGFTILDWDLAAPIEDES